MDALLKLEHISKYYPGVRALNDVSLEIFPGEVVGLVGENGAGKSSLIKLITGATTPSEGRLHFGQTDITDLGPAERMLLGISALYQEFSLFPEMSVADNIFYGREFVRGFFLDKQRMEASASELLKELGVDIDPGEKVKNLSVGHQQIVELAKALSMKSTLLIMDEPSAPLTNHEVEFLYAAVRKLKESGVAIIYVSHRLEEVYELCSRVIVLRDGTHIKTGLTRTLPRDEMISLMVGRSVESEFPERKGPIGEIVLEVTGLSSRYVKDVSFDVRRGEILGLAGLVGAGRTESVRILFGADKKTGGQIRLNGEATDIASPRMAIEKGLGLIPEDRKHHGLMLTHSILFNIVVATLSKFATLGFINASLQEKAASEARRKLSIKMASSGQPVGTLSGGNQQKVVLAKWLETNADIFIFDEPTRGIDVGAKYEIYCLMRELAANGKAIIMISSEMPELLGLSDRVTVLHEGRSMGTLQHDQLTPEAVLRLASGEH